MFRDLDEHPLFKQQRNQLHNTDDQLTKRMNLDTSIVKTRPPIPSDSIMKSRSKSVSNLLDNDKHDMEQLAESEKPSQLNSTSSFYQLDDNVNSEHHEVNEDDISPFPIPNKDSFLKSRTDINMEELDSFSAKKIFYENAETRHELLTDLIIKEKQYLVLIKILINEYFFNFSNNVNFNKVINAKEREIIFNNLNNIYDLHKLNILPELEQRERNWFNLSIGDRTVCDIFVKHLKNINFYNDYIDNFTKSIQCLNKYSCSKKNFQLKSALCLIDIKVENKYIDIFNQMRIDHPTTITIRSLLNYVQIWPEIANKFLIAYENFISIESVEFKYFNQTIGYFNELATKAIESIEDMKREDIMVCVQNRIGNKFSITDKKRTLVKQGILVTLSPQLGIIIRVYVILLNDLLIICDQNDSQFEKLKPKKPLDVDGMMVSDDVDAFTNDQLQFKFPQSRLRSVILSKENGLSINVPVIQKVFRFYARNYQEKLKWFNALRIVAQANVKPMDIDRTYLGKIRPRLIPDRLLYYCLKCKIEFNPLNRRHHCKACGYMFCRNCSKLSCNLDYEKISSKKLRVCDYCFDYMSRFLLMSHTVNGATKTVKDEININNSHRNNSNPT